MGLQFGFKLSAVEVVEKCSIGLQVGLEFATVVDIGNLTIGLQVGLTADVVDVVEKLAMGLQVGLVFSTVLAAGKICIGLQVGLPCGALFVVEKLVIGPFLDMCILVVKRVVGWQVGLGAPNDVSIGFKVVLSVKRKLNTGLYDCAVVVVGCGVGVQFCTWKQYWGAYVKLSVGLRYLAASNTVFIGWLVVS